MRGIRWLVLVLLVGISVKALPQSEKSERDTTSKSISHSPPKAALYSALLPGLGQAYNRKHWKIPVIYAGFASLAYFIDRNNSEYQRFKTAYASLTDDDPLTIDEFGGTRSSDELLFYKDQFRRSRDLSIILSVAFYALNIIDANVDAHFFDYSISPELSLRLDPAISPEGWPGLSLRLGY